MPNRALRPMSPRRFTMAIAAMVLVQLMLMLVAFGL